MILGFEFALCELLSEIIFMNYSNYLLIATTLLFIVFAHSNQPPSTPYSQDVGLTYLLFSYTAMCEPSVIESWSCKRCSEYFPTATSPRVYYHNATDIIGYSVIYNNTIIAVFKGTTGFLNVIVDIEFLRKDYPNVPGAKVHDGFYDSWLDVRSQVQEGITNQFKECPDCSLFVTGHSMGGAISTFCTLELLDWFPNVPLFTYTYGSPRVGNNVFAEYYNSRQPNTWRVTNQKDLVPHLPPQESVNEYHHVPNEIWYPHNVTSYVICDDSGEDPSCSDSVNPLEYSIKYHLEYFGQDCNCV
ncbi:hypothetical protein PPL_03582 [Heterostelium album PN500]|uniref:Fungal lipase-type domain-containing protein n=1 Tax=Heterostelium pallidum (strain ATCC 26659 / Pp 5 / PN500) TaxID=670386 RepID=D3B570_HETP5|nr:hypothetical protein PPL_03582 [Heterostelium album PN500]EFA83435.1 hypothetical protein PPL_03582 [Heterostelium album PN500]|eukprot:XP_020435552.1 hypothetical protein PPL_03582 [Heterostelium album PN500]